MKNVAFTKYAQGSLRQLGVFSFPLVLSLLSSYLPNICDRLFLAHYSTQALEGCAAAGGLSLLFHVFIWRVTSTAQAFVAEYIGQGQEKELGPLIWQMIWFSLGVMLFLVPLGKGVSTVFFRVSEIKELAQLYFDYMLYGTFFIGIEGALGGFYLGIGRTRLILYFNLLAHLLNVLLSYLLIFGIGDMIPEMGLEGAAIGTLLSKGISVLLLFGHFVRRYWNSPYHGADFKLRISLMREGLSKGLARSLGHIVALLKWNVIAYFMIQRGGDYLLALSYGTSLFYPFFNEGISLGTITIASYLKGAKSMRHVFKLLRSSFVLITIGLLCVAIPLLCFPRKVVDLYMGGVLNESTRELLTSCCRWVWVMYVCNGVYLVALSFVTSFKETWFYLKLMTFGIIFWSFLPVYYAIKVKGASPEMFWILVSMQPLYPALILFGMLSKRYFYPLYRDRVSLNHIDNNVI